MTILQNDVDNMNETVSSTMSSIVNGTNHNNIVLVSTY